MHGLSSGTEEETEMVVILFLISQHGVSTMNLMLEENSRYGVSNRKGKLSKSLPCLQCSSGIVINHTSVICRI